MIDESQDAPSGLARRRRRLSDQETERRMLEAAVSLVSRSGLTVSLDHISLEDVIRDADVSRSAVYRRWPYKDLFFSDLVRELARDATPTIVGDEIELMQRVVAERHDWFETPELRRGLVVELCRQLALLDFDIMVGSARWRTYLALNATFMSLAEGELRQQVRRALEESERARTARVAEAWTGLASVFGYRLRPELGASFEDLAMLLSATLRGLVVMALSTPEIAKQRAHASPFGAQATEQWSLAAIGVASLASSFLQPDPAVEWDEERRASVVQALVEWVPPDPSTSAARHQSPTRGGVEAQ